MDKEIYVLVCEKDTFRDYGRPIIWEQYLDIELSKMKVEEQQELLGNRYGKTAIAKLVFDEDQDISWLGGR